MSRMPSRVGKLIHPVTSKRPLMGVDEIEFAGTVGNLIPARRIACLPSQGVFPGYASPWRRPYAAVPLPPG